MPVAGDRRARILDVATRLFRERGFHAVGIDEIGAAAGISGPGVYRHFEGKDDLLVSVFDAATDDLWEGPAGASLESYVRSHVDYAAEHADAIELWYQEGRHLPADARSKQRRIQRRYVDHWVAALRAERPDLAEADAYARSLAVIGMVHSAAHAGTITDRPVLTRMALAALRA